MPNSSKRVLDIGKGYGPGVAALLGNMKHPQLRSQNAWLGRRRGVGDMQDLGLGGVFGVCWLQGW